MTAGSGLKVLLVAEEAAGVQVLRRLLQSPVEVTVLTSRPEDVARGATVWHLAQSQGLECLPPRRVRRPAFADEIRARGIDLLLNVHSLCIAAGAVVAAPRIGSFNLHPGPLPRYAGLNGPSFAILHGEREYGVTLHWMDAEIDTGDVAYQTLFPVEPDATGIRLASRCVREGVALVDALLSALERGESIPRHAQDPTRRSYFGRGAPEEMALRFERPAAHVDACVRAADYRPLPSPWGSPHARCAGERVEILKVALTGIARGTAAPGSLVRDDAGDVRVACGDAWLSLQRVARGGRAGSAAELLAGAGRLEDGR